LVLLPLPFRHPVANPSLTPGYQGSTRTTTGANPASHVVDPRLTAIVSAVPDIFNNQKILDVGCNNGHIAVDIGTPPEGYSLI
jgi:hypothetical protein